MSIKIKIAERDVDRDAIFRCRHRVYVEEMGAMPPREDGRILDVFDTYSKTVNIACIADGRVVGGLRLTEGGDSLGLPADRLFNYKPFMPENARHTSSSMLFVEKPYRNRTELIVGLFMMGYFWSVNRGASFILAPVNPPVARKLMRLGFHSVSDRFEVQGVPVKAMLWDLKNANDLFLSFLKKMEINTFALNFHREFFEEGEYLMRQGDPADCAYVLVEGEADVTLGEPGSADEKVVGLLSEGDLAGEIALLASGKRTANVRARKHVDTVVLDRERFQSEVVSNPKQSLRLLEIIGGRFARMSQVLSESSKGRNSGEGGKST
jgi:N-acyl-L-homoserine lactone synthetase